MAETRGAVVTALLLLCWRGAVPQPINMTSGAPTDMPPLSKAQEDSPGLFAKEGPPATPDELLVQEMLSANKSAVSEAQTTATALSTKFLKEKNLGLDEPFALGAGIAEGFRAPTEGPQFSVGGEDKILNSEPTMEDTFQMEDSSTFREPPFSSGKEEKDPKEGKKGAKNDQYKLSVLDKILQNMGKSSGDRGDHDRGDSSSWGAKSSGDRGDPGSLGGGNLVQ